VLGRSERLAFRKWAFPIPLHSYHMRFRAKGMGDGRLKAAADDCCEGRTAAARASMKNSTNPHQQLARGSDAGRRASGDLAVQNIEAAPYGPVER
jgi:hypothetical protein